MAHHKALIYVCLLFVSLNLHAQNKTPDDWKCVNKVGGQWTFGRAPSGCDASSFGDDKLVQTRYKDLIFQDNVSRSPELNRYMGALYLTLRDTALYYYQSRKGKVSTEEGNAWVRAVFAMAHQESYWSHYRVASDKRLKMMRGDFGHGHGILQVDDRWHFAAVNQGKAWNLLDNVMYGMEEYFDGWERAPSQKCVASSKDWRNRARAAYSAYNGGPSQICRFTTTSKWSRNDEGYVEKYDGLDWAPYAPKTPKAAPIDIACLVENSPGCELPQDKPAQPSPESIALFKDGHACRYVSKELVCVSDASDRACLGLPASAPVVQGNEAWLAQLTVRTYDRHTLCKQNIVNLGSVGSFITALKDLNLQLTPKGVSMGVWSQGSKAQVLNFIIDPETSDRYYQIELAPGVEAYVKSDVLGVSIGTGRGGLVASPSERRRIRLSSGINMRAEPDGTILGTLPVRTVVQVQSVQVRGTENRVYYQVTSQGQTGFIYAGRLLPESNLSEWTTPLD